MKEDLIGHSTVKRRKAAIFLQKNKMDEDCCSLLHEALEIEKAKNNWQTKLELINTIGLRGCKSMTDYIKNEFINNSEEYSLLSIAAAKAYVRLKRKNLEDATAVIELIDKNKYSLTEGALEALGYDKMIPPVEQQKLIIVKCRKFGGERSKGYTDPRYGLVAACAKWDADITNDFLMECKMSTDAPLKYVVEKSLKGEYCKLR